MIHNFFKFQFSCAPKKGIQLQLVIVRIFFDIHKATVRLVQWQKSEFLTKEIGLERPYLLFENVRFKIKSSAPDRSSKVCR